MEDWAKVSLILCFFGVLKEFRPSEPFVTKYFNNPPMNFTLKEIYTDIYPVGTYATVILLIFVFLVTDLVRYKPIIVLQGISGVLTFTLLIVCRKLIWIQVAEVFYGLFTACDVAYFTYTYAKVDKSHYQEVTGHTRSAYLVGRAVSGIVSQALISFNYFSYFYLNFFTLGGLIFATLWAFLLPGADKSIYFNRSPRTSISHGDKKCAENPQLDSSASTKVSKSFFQNFSRGFKYVCHDFTTAFTSYYVIKWTIWWALATCGYYQVWAYIQVLWEDVTNESGSNKSLYSNLNGAVEAIYTIMSAVATFACGKILVNWEKIGEITLASCSILIGVVLYIMSQAQVMWIAYVTYIIYAVIYHSMITIANSEVAKCLNPDSHGLIFGITTFVALVLQTILTMIVNSYLSLPGRTQFLVYATYFTVIGVIFAVMSVFSWIRSRGRSQSELSITQY